MAAGGKRPGAGRPKGAPNKATAEVRDVAQGYTNEAVTTLVSIFLDKDQPAASRVAAAREILDRGHGRSKQSIEHNGSIEYVIETAVPRDPCDPPIQAGVRVIGVQQE